MEARGSGTHLKIPNEIMKNIRQPPV